LGKSGRKRKTELLLQKAQSNLKFPCIKNSSPVYVRIATHTSKSQKPLSWRLGSDRNMAFILRTALFWVITQRVVVIYYRRFGTTCRFHSEGSRIFPFFFYFLTMRIGPTGYPETSVSNYHYPLRNNPQQRSSHLLRGGSLKSHIAFIVSFDSLQWCDR
jgi:hypothetical protein